MELTYTNERGNSLNLRSRPPFFLKKLDGTQSVKQSVSTFKAPGQDGAFFISAALDMRNITIEGTLVAASPADAYERQKQFLQVFSPKQRGTLQTRGRQISCVVEDAGFTVSTRERIPNFFVSLLCPSPFFESLSDVREELASWIPSLSFALEIPADGIEFGARQPNQIITVTNVGDVPCGCEIVFRALGTVRNPELLDMDSGEVVRLNVTMSAGDEYHVYTHFAGKRVIKSVSGAETNAFSLLDTASSFFQLSPGVNTLRYNAATNMDLLEVSIFYRPQFLAG